MFQQVCEEGRCIRNPCAGLICGPQRVCIDGQCRDDGCRFMNCQDGEMCVQRPHGVQCERMSEVEEDRQRQIKQRQRDQQADNLNQQSDSGLSSDLDLGPPFQDQTTGDLVDQSELIPVDFGLEEPSSPPPSPKNQEGCAQHVLSGDSSTSGSSQNELLIILLLLVARLGALKQKSRFFR